MSEETRKIFPETYCIPASEPIETDPIFNPKTGEIYRKKKWISKEEAKKIWPDPDIERKKDE